MILPRPLPLVASFVLGVIAILGIALATARASGEPPPAAGSGSAIAAGSGSGSASAPTIPDDPIAAPSATIDSLRSAKAVGWACLAFAVLTVLARVVGRLGKGVKALAWLNHGKAAVLVGAAGALALATYNALALGGTLLAAALAGLVALAHYLDATPREAA